MTSGSDFLVEIGTEELPPKALRQLAGAFNDGVAAGLRHAGLLADDARTEWYCSPRRLAVKAYGLPAAQADQVQERLGPAVAAAFGKDGKPTKAAEGFAASCGTSVEKLARRKTDKGERLAAVVKIEGRKTAALLPQIVTDALRRLPVPRRMRWGAGTEEFIRPVHWVVMLLGKDVVPCEILGIAAGRETRGHRFHAPDPLKLTSPADYPERLERKGHVRVADASGALDDYILACVREAAGSLGGTPLHADADNPLVAEVASLNEWPVPVVGHFAARYLELPEEVLITTLEHHQRYFPVRGKDGRLLPDFITFANIESKDPAVVRRGNERVVVPRLEDALFFWNTDRKRTLHSRVAALDEVVFQRDLGTLGDKRRRVGELAAVIGKPLGAGDEPLRRAAELSKCDLLTEMVGEFPELQGIMGRYYAEADGESADVAQAIGEQYLPRFANDRLPASVLGQALAIADKLDTVCGVFAIGQRPSGDKDPFALRRQTLGVLRIMIESALELDLRVLIRQALQPIRTAGAEGAFADDVFAFCMDRLRGYFVEQGVRPEDFEAVAATGTGDPLDFSRRLDAIRHFAALPEAQALAAANKRVANILRQAKDDIPQRVVAEKLAEPAEMSLWKALQEVTRSCDAALASKDYGAALRSLATLRMPVDAFFDTVMVMADDASLRTNRLALLQHMRGQFMRVADVSQLHTA